jgi:hypothetical protein
LLVASIAATVAGFGLLAAEAGADVQNGGFDLSTCAQAGCTGEGWTQTEAPFGTGADAIGPICGANPIPTNCDANGSGYNTYGNWARIAAGIGTAGSIKSVYSSVSQTVTVPAAPATLRFVLRIVPGSPQFNDSYFTVRLDNETVFFADSFETGYTNYTAVLVDVSAFAGQTRSLIFGGTSSFFGTHSYSFDIDDVSIRQGPVPPASVAAETGQRAAALAKCKKKKSKKARKKCKRKANLLPV